MGYENHPHTNTHRHTHTYIYIYIYYIRGRDYIAYIKFIALNIRRPPQAP